MPIELAPTAAPAAVEGATAPAAATKPATTFESVKAARREAQAGDITLERAESPGAAKPPKVEIEMTDEELAKATQLSKEAREAKARAKELEAGAAGTAKFKEAEALVAKGQHLKAAELLGLDLNAAVAEALGTQVEGEAVDPKLAEITKKLEELSAGAAERAKRDAEELAARTTEVRKADVAAIVEHVKAQAATFPYLSRNPAWVQEAYDTAIDVYPAAVKQAGRELNAEEKHRLITAALEEKEAEHVTKAKLYGAAPVALERPGGAVPPRPSARPTTFDSSMRGGTSAATTKPKTKLTFHEAKRARRTAS